MAFREFSKNNLDTIRVTPKVYGGYELIDVRIFTRLTTGELVPTKKGISINVEKVPELINALTWALGAQNAEQIRKRYENGKTCNRMERLAEYDVEILQAHRSHVHWDLAERGIGPISNGRIFEIGPSLRAGEQGRLVRVGSGRVLSRKRRKTKAWIVLLRTHTAHGV